MRKEAKEFKVKKGSGDSKSSSMKLPAQPLPIPEPNSENQKIFNESKLLFSQP